ncbi:MAG: hypothetical protein FWC95_07470 [Defluviitaleaceae bacterium]|nr:hypothetical protein [Defluviitaleaceae bacterium]
MNQNSNDRIEVNSLCFAKWRNGYYYPGVVRRITSTEVTIDFLDGSMDRADSSELISLRDGLANLALQGNWKQGFFWYKGRLGETVSPREAMTFYYDDGDIEEIALKQLRGKLDTNVHTRRDTDDVIDIRTQREN